MASKCLRKSIKRLRQDVTQPFYMLT
jgi:hypothetical protein